MLVVLGRDVVFVMLCFIFIFSFVLRGDVGFVLDDFMRYLVIYVICLVVVKSGVFY